MPSLKANRQTNKRVNIHANKMNTEAKLRARERFGTAPRKISSGGHLSLLKPGHVQVIMGKSTLGSV